MNFIKKYWLPIVLVLVIITLVVIVEGSPSIKKLAGAPSPQTFTTFTNLYISGQTQEGVNGSIVNADTWGSCTGIDGGATMQATSTYEIDCAIPNMPATSTPSTVQVSLANPQWIPGAPTWGGITVVGSGASTTAGYISITLLNLTGKAQTVGSFSYATSSIQYEILY